MCPFAKQTRVCVCEFHFHALTFDYDITLLYYNATWHIYKLGLEAAKT